MPKLVLTEAKNIGDHAATKTPWKHHGIMGSLTAVFSRGRHQVLYDVGQRVVYARFVRLEAQFRRELESLFQGINQHSSRKMKKVFRTFYYEAFKLGKLSAEGGYRGMSQVRLSEEDKRWLETFLRKEFDFWKKFTDDVKEKRGKLDYGRRKELYVQSLKAMYNSARIVSTPPTTLFYWETTPAEHCSHCLYLARKSPYTKDNLPAVPAAGDTKCKSNCRCHLRIEHASVTKYLRVKKNAPTRQQLQREMKALK